MIRRFASLASLLLFAEAPAQTFLVDDDGGPGVHFTDLPAAVSAVPDGSTLRVRAGTYSGFQVRAKSLRILGDHFHTVRIATGAAVRIEALRSDQELVLKDLTITSGSLTLASALGPVVLDRVDVYGFPSGAMLLVQGCSDVHLHRSDFSGVEIVSSSVEMSDSLCSGSAGFSSLGGGRAGEEGGSLRDSRLTLYRSSIFGGHGGNSTCCGLPFGGPGGDGGAGLGLNQSTLFLYRGSIVQGGDGGAPNQYFSGGDGGVGVLLENGSTAFFEGALPRGGVGEQNAPPFTQSQSRVVEHPSATPALADLIGFPQLGSTVQMRLNARAFSTSVLLLGRFTTHVPLEPLAKGSLLTNPVAFVGPFAVPANGVLDVPFAIPHDVPLDQCFSGQFLSLEAGTNELWPSNLFLFLVKS